MGVSDFPKDQYWILFNSSGSDIQLGKFAPTTSFRMHQMQIWLTKVGANSGTEQFRMKVYADDAYSQLLAMSDWVDVDQFGDLETATDWIGYVTFDFAGEPINANNAYYVAAEAAGYSRPSDFSFYMAMALDWPESVNTQAASDRAGGGFSVIGRFDL